MPKKVKESGLYQMGEGTTMPKKGMHMMPGNMPMKDAEMKRMMRKKKGKGMKNA